jgi:hypothetical protein
MFIGSIVGGGVAPALQALISRQTARLVNAILLIMRIIESFIFEY